MKKLVLKIMWGGLGDHLLYTPIPRVAKQFGYDKVYISNKSQYRNLDTKKIVWEPNPYIDGFCEEDAPHPNFAETRPGYNVLDDIMHFYGIPNDGVRYREPEIYHKTELLPLYKDSIIFDPNSINKTGVPSREQINKYFLRNDIQIDYEMIDLYNQGFTTNRPIIKATLHQMCNLVVSCKHLYCLTTGVATLAAALRKPSTVLYVPGVKPMFHHSKIHFYANVGVY
jgi:hypothetical protein